MVEESPPRDEPCERVLSTETHLRVETSYTYLNYSHRHTDGGILQFIQFFGHSLIRQQAKERVNMRLKEETSSFLSFLPMREAITSSRNAFFFLFFFAKSEVLRSSLWIYFFDVSSRGLRVCPSGLLDEG